MAFFRPEAVKPLLRWSETAAYGAATLGGAAWLLAEVHDPAWRWGLVGVTLLIGAAFIRAAALSALAAADEVGPGVVMIDERRIAYFGPNEGGVASINEIFQIEIATAAPDFWEYEPRWILRWSREEAALIVPATAKGAEGLPDAFAALPGFEPSRAITALRGPEGAHSTIWRRPGTPDEVALVAPDT